MSTLMYILISTCFISFGSLVGIFTLSIKEKYLEKILNKLDPASDLKLFHWDNYTQVGKYLGNKIHY